MKMNLYTIYDQKLEAYNQPFFWENDAMALRQFADMANDENFSISKHPEDYSLWHLGTWSNSDAKLKIIQKKLIGSAHEHVIQYPQET
jgi:hypothetical protein